MKLKNLVLFLASAGFAFSQGVPVNVQKTPGTNAITGSLVIGAGKTLTASGGGTITASAVSAAGISGVIPIANLATGTPDGTKFVADDGTLKSVPGGGDALTANPLNQFAATTSAQFLGVITNATGTGFVVGSDSPIFTTQITAPKIVYATSIIELSGSGTPEGAVTANIGSVFHRTNGSTATTLYVKESGTGNTGWAAVGGGGGGGIGGSSGSTDNALIRADGTGGATVQASTVTLSDAGVLAGATEIVTPQITFDTGGATLAGTGGDLILTQTGTHYFGLTHTSGAPSAGAAFVVDGPSPYASLRLRDGGAVRYRSDMGMSSTGLAISAYDDTGAVYLPVTLVGTEVDVLLGNLSIVTVGKTLAIKSGSNAKSGTFTLTSGIASVSNTSVTANSVIVATVKTSSGTLGLFSPEIVINAGVGFSATGAVTDNSTYNFIILEVN